MCVKIGLCSEVNTDIEYFQEHDAKENVWTCESNRKVEKCSVRRFTGSASRIRTKCPDPARKLSANLYDIYHCCVYSEKLPMIDRGTVRNM